MRNEGGGKGEITRTENKTNRFLRWQSRTEGEKRIFKTKFNREYYYYSFIT